MMASATVKAYGFLPPVLSLMCSTGPELYAETYISSPPSTVNCLAIALSISTLTLVARHTLFAMWIFRKASPPFFFPQKCSYFKKISLIDQEFAQQKFSEDLPFRKPLSREKQEEFLAHANIPASKSQKSKNKHSGYCWSNTMMCSVQIKMTWVGPIILDTKSLPKMKIPNPRGSQIVP
jgi:hypothetical protein